MRTLNQIAVFAACVVLGLGTGMVIADTTSKPLLPLGDSAWMLHTWTETKNAAGVIVRVNETKKYYSTRIEAVVEFENVTMGEEQAAVGQPIWANLYKVKLVAEANPFEQFWYVRKDPGPQTP